MLYNSSLVGLRVAAGNTFFLTDFKCDNEGLPPIVDIVNSGSCGWSLCYEHSHAFQLAKIIID